MADNLQKNLYQPDHDAFARGYQFSNLTKKITMIKINAI